MQTMVPGSNGNDSRNSFAKTICSICYEDLKPIVEDLQSISVCGHVFHELCLQQWFEYCPNAKKRSCPICKQACTKAGVARLYFQSVGDPNDSTQSQKQRDHEKNHEEIEKELWRLEGKVMAMSSTLAQQQKEFKEVKNQLFSCKEQLKVELALKNEVITQMSTNQQLLRIKSEELDRSTLECMRLQENNMALAKELAAVKLASDPDLVEDEVMKLASLGNEVGSRETVDVLRKSLVLRNKRYNELMAKCSVLGRGEARCLHKLEKANEKIMRLKLRVQELETAMEIKDNESLRGLKYQKADLQTDSYENRIKKLPVFIDLDEINMPTNALKSQKAESCQPTIRRSSNDLKNQEKGHSVVNTDTDAICLFSSAQRLLPEKSRPCTDNDSVPRSCHVPIQDAYLATQDDGVSLPQVPRKCTTGGRITDPDTTMDDEVVCYDGRSRARTSVPIEKDIRSMVPFAEPGSHCFSGGVLGPDGTNWHLGKWCKKAKNQDSAKPFTGVQRSNAGSGDLIAVGADGRGGQIKVMKSFCQPQLDTKDVSSWTRKGKHASGPNKLQPWGRLQIEHFFCKTGP